VIEPRRFNASTGRIDKLSRQKRGVTVGLGRFISDDENFSMATARGGQAGVWRFKCKQ
jgi:hypothetical protein